MSTNYPTSDSDGDAKSLAKHQPQPVVCRRFNITYKLPDGSLETVVESYASLDEAIFQAEQQRVWHSTVESVEEA
jgi:hypothetical protein